MPPSGAIDVTEATRSSRRLDEIRSKIIIWVHRPRRRHDTRWSGPGGGCLQSPRALRRPPRGRVSGLRASGGHPRWSPQRSTFWWLRPAGVLLEESQSPFPDPSCPSVPRRRPRDIESRYRSPDQPTRGRLGIRQGPRAGRPRPRRTAAPGPHPNRGRRRRQAGAQQALFGRRERCGEARERPSTSGIAEESPRLGRVGMRGVLSERFAVVLTDASYTHTSDVHRRSQDQQVGSRAVFPGCPSEPLTSASKINHGVGAGSRSGPVR